MERSPDAGVRRSHDVGTGLPSGQAWDAARPIAKRGSLLFGLIILTFTLPSLAQDRAHPHYAGLDTNVYLTVTPKPKQERYRNRFIKIATVTISVQNEANDLRIIEPFRTYCGKELGLTVPDDPSAGKPQKHRLLVHVGVKRLSEAQVELPPHPHPDQPEGYVLKLQAVGGAAEAAILGNSAKGCQHGLQSLRQLLLKWRGSVIAREAEIVDWPSIPFRFVKRPFAYWLDQSVRYKLNGGSMGAHPTYGLDLEKFATSMERFADTARERNLYLLGMVGMGNIYKGAEAAIAERVAVFRKMLEIGYTHLAVMNDDRMTLADPEARERFGGYFATQVSYVNRIDEALRKVGYRHRLGYLPNHYYGRDVDKPWAKHAVGKLPRDIALFWCGLRTPGPEVTREHLTHIREQTGVGHLWFYANWPQCGGPYYAGNYGAARNRDFGNGDLVELVTVSTTTYPRAFPTSFITHADLLWNPEGYDPDRALLRATKEVVSPESFPAFYALFRYLESIAPCAAASERSPRYASEDAAERRAILEARCARMDELVAACLKLPEAQDPRAKKVLETMMGRKEGYLERLAREEQQASKGIEHRRIACPLAAQGPTLDGKLDDEAWKEAAVADRFTDLSGKNAAPHQTTVKLLRTQDKLYVAIACQESHLADPEFLRPGFTYPLAIEEKPGGFLWWAESVEVFFDPGRDQRKVYQLMLNPWGLKQCIHFDSLRYGFYGKSNEFNTNWPVEGKADVMAESWSLEFAIPLSAFGDEEPTGTWGFNVARTRRLRAGEGLKYSTWTPLGWGFQDARNFGILTFADKAAN